MKTLQYFLQVILFSVFLLSGISKADIFITEIADPDNDAGARFVELYNNGSSAVDLSTGWALQRWTNANTDPQAPVSLTGTIEAGGFYLVSPNGTQFATVYGFSADQDIGTGGPADSNGDDNIALLDASGAIVDLFGVPGEDGSGTDHEFEDGRAERKETVTTGANPWVASEWNIDNDSGGGDGPQNAPGDFDPGAWIGAPVSTTTVSFASSGASVAEDSGTYDLIVSITNPDGSNATSADVALISGDAADINNYTTQTVTFPAGSSADQTVVITITDDSEVEGDEVLTFELQNVSGGNSAAAASPSQFNLTIEDNDTAPTPDIVINEIMQNPSAVGDSDGEWFELFNPTGSAVDINGWTIKDDGSDSHTIDNGGALTIAAGGYLVLGINGDSGTNGGVTVDYVYSGLTLGNSDDEVVLVYSDGVSEVDRVNYDGGTNFPDPTGASMELNNPSNDNTVGSNWNEATATFGAGDLGTPGAQNSTFVNSIERGNPAAAASFKLYVNFPNPFNPSTTLRFDVPQHAENIELAVYDVIGQKVVTLYQGSATRGQYTTRWNGTNQNGQNVPSGVYFGVLKSASFNQTIKMMLLK